MLALSPVCVRGHRHYAPFCSWRSYNPHSIALCCHAPPEIGASMFCVTCLLDLIERPWRLVEHSLADPSPHDEWRHAGGRGSLPH